MQSSLNAYRPIPKDDTLDEYIQKSAQLKDIIINLLDAWLEHNIEMFPADEQEAIRNLITDRKAGGNISNRKPQ